MKTLKSYSNTVCELNLLKKRFNLLSNYEKYINDEKKKISNMMIVQEKIINQMEADIQKLKGIENKLYYEIVINGLGITRAIDKVASSEFVDVSTLWKNYYPKIKPEIEKLYLIISGEEVDQKNI